MVIGEYKIYSTVTDALWAENCYLVKHLPSSEAILIDPGNNGDEILDVINESNSNLKAIFLTHGHHDHVGAVSTIQSEFRIPVYVHHSERNLINRAHSYALVFGKTQMEPLEEMTFTYLSNILIDESFDVRIIHTPGHTPGSVSYLLDDFIFTGDTLLYKHVGRTDLPGSDLDELKSSIDGLLTDLPEKTVIFPGHGRFWTIVDARRWWFNVKTSPPVYNRFGGI